MPASRPVPYLRVVSSRDSDELDVATLAEALRGREPWAIEATWRAHAADVFALLLRAVGSRKTAAALTRDVFLEVCAAARQLDAKGDLRTFIRRAAVRVLGRHFRWARVLRTLRLTKRRSRGDELQTHLRGRVRSCLFRLYEALDELPAKDRLVYTLFWIEELPFSEVAALTGITVSGAESQALRAQERLDRVMRGDSLLESYVGGRGVAPNSPEGA